MKRILISILFLISIRSNAINWPAIGWGTGLLYCLRTAINIQTDVNKFFAISKNPNTIFVEGYVDHIKSKGLVLGFLMTICTYKFCKSLIDSNQNNNNNCQGQTPQN